MNKILITGATGFIGSHIVRRFCRDGDNNGSKVLCLVRGTSSLANIKGLPVEIRQGDIEDPKTLISAFKGCDFIIHTAARANDWDTYDKFYRTNVEGTLNVLKACSENKIKDVIITGSISSYGEENSRQMKDESFPYKSHYRYFLDKVFPCRFNYYRDTKALATQEAIKYAKTAQLNLTVIEPVWVYGEREFKTGFFEYLKTAKRKPMFLPGSKHNKFHVIYAGDLARAYYLVFEKKLTGINRIIIGNQRAELMDDIYTLFCREAGIKKPLSVPRWLVYPSALILEWSAAVLNFKSAPLLTRGRVNMFYDNIEYSTEKAVKLLGFTNSFSLEEGVRKTVQWYRKKLLI